MSAVGPRAIVSGGARGIGLAIAERVVAEGGRVIIGDVDHVRGDQVAGLLGEQCTFLPWDVADEGQTQAVFAAAQDAWGGVEQVYANAGFVGVTGPIAHTSLTDWQATVGVLLTGAFLTVKHAVQLMAPAGHGAIVCTASVASIRGGLGPHAYTAAKAGLRGLIESVAVEVAPLGLRINGVAPGGVVSSLSAGLVSGDPDDLATASERLANSSSSGVPTTASDVADAAIFLAGSQAKRINGALLVIDGGDTVLGSSGRAFFSQQ